ncbi:hypothetical protein [Massilia sp. MS-15]|uniref:hypothetical protein n=1 Tax=Massilia sp. MS-15 TaxID=2878200 RepID=UPI001CD6D105|nr:hypothetical protein [Massilia sp. MS-15]MCA1246747.1 hypothetical protein [Massilia sp. MS-15]
MAVVACSNDSEVGHAIGKLVRARHVTELRLADATKFDWEQVYIFAPYTPRTAVCDTLGIQVKYCARFIPFESTDDGEMSLAFVTRGRLVHYARHSRFNGDFMPVLAKQPLLRTNAVFQVVPDGTASDGRTWFKLVAK